MASFKEKVASVAVEQAVKYARKDFKRNAPRILNLDLQHGRTRAYKACSSAYECCNKQLYKENGSY